jgi:hypothetical protein
MMIKTRGVTDDSTTVRLLESWTGLTAIFTFGVFWWSFITTWWCLFWCNGKWVGTITSDPGHGKRLEENSKHELVG